MAKRCRATRTICYAFLTEPRHRGQVPATGHGVPFLHVPPWLLLPHKNVPHLVQTFA